jgi:predicted solute-binding protein
VCVSSTTFATFYSSKREREREREREEEEEEEEEDQVPKLSFLKNRSRETFVSEEVCMLYLSSCCEY